MSIVSKRQLPSAPLSAIAVSGNNRSAHYARHWLRLLGAESDGSPAHAEVVVVAGAEPDTDDTAFPYARAVIRVWDFQVHCAGTGVLASGASGAASVIGWPGCAGVALPSDMPEKWCGAFGVILALAEQLRDPVHRADKVQTYDISSADILHAFALQNAGSSGEIRTLWRRNGRICVNHLGIFPMGFYPCADGFVALLGRSKRDWRNIREAIGNPEWAMTPAFEDPIALARDSAVADAHVVQTLASLTRDELLARGLSANAVIAPVYTQEEALSRGIFRDNFADDGVPNMPFVRTPLPALEQPQAQPRFRPPVSDDTTDGPLKGLRCLELCWVWSGPMVGQMLADLGAEVLKVETRTRFDLYRTRGLEHLRGKMDEAERLESSAHFHSLNRNKLGLDVDLKSAEGKRQLLSLVAESDVLIENFTAGTMERLDLDADTLARHNPQLIQVSMSGPGRGSAVESLRSYGLVLSALGGAEVRLRQNDEFVGSPTFSLSDPNAATFGAMAVLAGVLNAREQERGSTMDLSQIEAAATLAGTKTLAASRHEAIVATSDGDYVAVSVPMPAFKSREAMLDVLNGLPESEIISRVSAAAGQCVRMSELAQAEASSTYAACGPWAEIEHPITGKEKLVGACWRINGQRPTPSKPAPMLGEHNELIAHALFGEQENSGDTTGEIWGTTDG